MRPRSEITDNAFCMCSAGEHTEHKKLDLLIKINALALHVYL